MNTLGQLEWHVMDAMADDWESVVQIRPHVAEFCGTTPDEAIFDVLRRLHLSALIRIMDADGCGTNVFPADAQGLWFSMTESGRELWDVEGHTYRSDA